MMGKKRIILTLILTLIIALTAIFFVNFHKQDPLLTIHIIDVDQGDSILITTPNKTILIDAGELHQSNKVVNYLKRNKIKTIDILIATHPHADHIGGIPKVIENFNINSFYTPEKVHITKTFENMLISARNKGLKISLPPINNPITLDEDTKLYFLSPIKDYGDNLNNWSIVVKLDYKNKSFLFTGDTEYEAEQDMLNKYKETLRSNFLKVAHHGSSSSTSLEFIKTINPQVAIISCGTDNSFNHPHREVIERLEALGITFYRTDFQGNIVIKSNGEEIWSNKKPHSSPSLN